MAPPLTFLEKKWAAGYGSSNHLIVAATQTTDRKQVNMLDRDTHRSITPFGRRTLMTLGRWLYWNVSAVRGTIDEMAGLVAQSYIPQFEGADLEWGNQVENWLYEHDKICDVRGWPFDMATYRENLIRGVLIDGDLATMLVKTATGYPMIQVFPAHRISGGINNESLVKGGPYDGARMVDGCIIDDTARVIAYRVWAENGEVSGTFQDVPARDMFLSYLPETPDQLRGISTLGASCFDWQDVSDARRFELIAQKLIASIGLIETNEAGEADKTKKLLGSGGATNRAFDTTEKTRQTTAETENVDGVSVRYFRAGSNSKIETLTGDRPTANQQAFRDDVVREALHGIGWSFDFSYNPTKIGGASMRVVVDRINRKLERLREKVLRKAQTRIDAYRIASVMDNPERTDKKIVLFPYNEEWFKWNYQGPGKLTADAKYNSDVDRNEMRAGIKSMAKAAGERGGYWRDDRQQIEIEADDALTRAKRLAKKHNVAVEVALVMIRDMTSYSTITNSADATSAAADAATPPPTDTPPE